MPAGPRSSVRALLPAGPASASKKFEVAESGGAVRVEQLPAQRCVTEIRGAPPLHNGVAPQYRGRPAAAD
jgi:hypothetical protein